MRIGVVSDTHGHVAYTEQAVRVLERQNVEAVLHCGDVGSADVVHLFAAWPTHFVFGNVDRDEEELREAIAAAGQTCHGRFGEIELAGRRIALVHSDDYARFRAAIAGGRFDLVCYGHTHAAEHHYEGDTLVLNPGALYRATPHSLVVVDLATMAVEPIAL